MYKSIRYYITIALVLLFIACEKEIEFSPKEQSPFLVINSYLSPDSLLKVGVSHSVSIVEKLSNNIVGDAEVKVYENEKLLETLKYDAVSHQYIGMLKPSVGRKYKTTVAKDGFSSIEATSVIEPAPEIIKCSIVTDVLNTSHANATITFKDPSGVRNFYRLVVANVDEFEEKPDWAKNYDWTGGYWIGNDYINYLVGADSTDPNLNGSSAAGFFDDVPKNIYNIFNDDLIDGKEYSLTFSYSLSNHPEANNRTIIYLQAISEDLHQYFRTLSAQYYFGEDPLLEPIQVYSNVKNGGGILGSYNANKLKINVDDLVIVQE